MNSGSTGFFYKAQTSNGTAPTHVKNDSQEDLTNLQQGDSFKITIPKIIMGSLSELEGSRLSNQELTELTPEEWKQYYKYMGLA